MGIEIPPSPKAGKGGKKRKPLGEDAKRAMFLAMCKANGIPEPVPEFRFAEDIGRLWRFDYFWGLLTVGSRAHLYEARGVALEIDGGAWSEGRHTRGQGFIDDQQKRNEAVLRGIWVLNCTPQDVEDGSVFALLRRALS